MSNRRISNISDIPVVTNDPYQYENPIKPEWFTGVHEAQLGKAVGLTQFGINRVILEPGAYSALRHWHTGEDEFVYVLEGELTLINNEGEHTLGPGSVAGFPAGEENAHHLCNRSGNPATFLAAGSRRPGEDVAHYPDDGRRHQPPGRGPVRGQRDPLVGFLALALCSHLPSAAF